MTMKQLAVAALLLSAAALAQDAPVASLYFHRGPEALVVNAGLADERTLALPLQAPAVRVGAVAAAQDGALLLYCGDDEAATSTVLHAYDLAAERLLWARPLERKGTCTFGWDAFDGDQFFMSVTHYSIYFPQDNEGDVYTAGLYSLADGSLLQTLPLFAAEPQSDYAYAVAYDDGLLTLSIRLSPYKGGDMRPRMYTWDGASLVDVEDDARQLGGFIYSDGVVLHLAHDPRVRIYDPLFYRAKNVLMQTYEGVTAPAAWLPGDVSAMFPQPGGAVLIQYNTERYADDGTISETLSEYVVLRRDGTLEGPQEGLYLDNYYLIYAADFAQAYGPFASADNLAAVMALNPPGRGTACEGEAFSQLVPTYPARIVGGPAGLHAEASASSPTLAELPDEANILVLDGPYCDDEGRLWWHAAYEGQMGYVVELQGADVFAEYAGD
jgi:hypothetical protein